MNITGGFYITNRLEPNIEVGERFDKDDIVAANSEFFIKDKITKDTVYKSGPLARVAVIHGSSVFEDSTLVTERLAGKMSSYVTFDKKIVIGKNSNIHHIAKVGEYVKVNEPLLVFDESYEDEYLSKLLDKMNQETREDILESGYTPIKAKDNGEIIDIKIYYTVPPSEMSESLQKVIGDYNKDVKKRESIFKKNGIEVKDLTYLNEVAKPTEPINGKIKGVKMEDKEILIEFYMRVLDKFAVGDKLTFGTALKGINQDLIPLGKEPYLVSDPEEKVDAFVGVSGVYARINYIVPLYSDI